MVKRINFCIILCFLFFIPVFLPAQTAAELDGLLESSKVTCSQAAKFVLASAGSESDDPFGQAVSSGWLPKKASPDKPINMGSLSLLMMKAFKIRGGVLYSIVKGPRYAYRAMVNRSFFAPGATDPGMTMNGERFLLILGNVLSYVEGEK